MLCRAGLQVDRGGPARTANTRPERMRPTNLDNSVLAHRSRLESITGSTEMTSTPTP